MAKRKASRGADRVRCEEHGDSVAAVICRHLREGSGLRYYAVRDDPWAWCEASNAVSERGAGWDRLSELADWQAVCHECYRRARRPPWSTAYVRAAAEREAPPPPRQ